MKRSIHSDEGRNLEGGNRRILLEICIRHANAKNREESLNAIAELLETSEDPCTVLAGCLSGVCDKVIAKELVASIASLGLNRNDVWNELVNIAENSYNHRAARRAARDICIKWQEDSDQRYWEERANDAQTPEKVIGDIIEYLERDAGSGRLLPPLSKAWWQFWR